MNTRQRLKQAAARRMTYKATRVCWRWIRTTSARNEDVHVDAWLQYAARTNLQEGEEP